MKTAMKVELQNVGKRYNRDWIFRKFNYIFEADGRYAVTGPNGSGKSTLLQILAGSLTHNEGSLSYLIDGKQRTDHEIYRQVSIAAPYLELIEEMTLREFFAFHGNLKGWMNNFCVSDIMDIISLRYVADRQIRYFSSGMKQRVKLGQAILSDAALVLLDEPATNLDEEGIQLYNRLIADFCQGKTVIVSSNDPKEYTFCKTVIDIKVYK